MTVHPESLSENQKAVLMPDIDVQLQLGRCDRVEFGPEIFVAIFLEV